MIVNINLHPFDFPVAALENVQRSAPSDSFRPAYSAIAQTNTNAVATGQWHWLYISQIDIRLIICQSRAHSPYFGTSREHTCTHTHIENHWKNQRFTEISVMSIHRRFDDHILNISSLLWRYLAITSCRETPRVVVNECMEF